MGNFVLMALLATLGTWLVTALGAATVVFFKSPHPKGLNIMLGFASGVMIAASFWSLLQPAIERAEAAGGIPAYLVATAGFLCGALFMWVSDKVVTLARAKADTTQGKEQLHRITMLILSITLHNIPEGMAVGLAFALAADGEGFAAACALSLGIGIQNLPEGAAVSLPLRQFGLSRGRAFTVGLLSAAVEPLFGIGVVLIAGFVHPLMPWFLSFAAGAMLYVTASELLPEAKGRLGTFSFIGGFTLMMILDVALG